MKLKRGEYLGASELACFDKELMEMNLEETRTILSYILHRASVPSPNSKIMFEELRIAEINAQEFPRYFDEIFSRHS